MTWDEFREKARLMQEEIVNMERELKNKVALYKAFTKEHIGLSDGEQTNVLHLAEIVDRVLGLKSK